MCVGGGRTAYVGRFRQLYIGGGPYCVGAVKIRYSCGIIARKCVPLECTRHTASCGQADVVRDLIFPLKARAKCIYKATSSRLPRRSSFEILLYGYKYWSAVRTLKFILLELQLAQISSFVCVCLPIKTLSHIVRPCVVDQPLRFSPSFLATNNLELRSVRYFLRWLQS